jgi:hypothetical protein
MPAIRSWPLGQHGLDIGPAVGLRAEQLDDEREAHIIACPYLVEEFMLGVGNGEVLQPGDPLLQVAPRPGVHALAAYPHLSATSVTGTPAPASSTARYLCSATLSSQSMSGECQAKPTCKGIKHDSTHCPAPADRWQTGSADAACTAPKLVAYCLICGFVESLRRLCSTRGSRRRVLSGAAPVRLAAR